MSFKQAKHQAFVNTSSEGVVAIDALVGSLRAAHPYAFHTLDSLMARRFFDQPIRELPHCGFVRAWEAGQEGK